MASNGENRVSKRSPYACTRCKKQKIKCSGQQPCANCARRNLVCVVNESEIKVVVTKGYLSALQARAARLDHTTGRLAQNPSPGPPVSRLLPAEHHKNQPLSSGHHSESNAHVTNDACGTASGASHAEDDTDSDAPKLANPLSITAAPKYMSSAKGLKSYLGPSSNWSFHGRVLNLVHTHIRHTPFPSSDFLFEGEAYGLPWNDRRDSLDPGKALVPGIDHATFLVNVVKFHCAQLFHLFEEEEFNARLQAFYSSTDDTTGTDLWYVHFLLVIALGKALAQNNHQAVRPSGSDLFQEVQQLLPDTDTLCRDPIVAMELLCCAALYLHALDSRNAAHVTIGQAMRIGQANGMHTDMPVQDLGETLVQRCRKIWWTVCLLDRQMTSLMGIPQSIRTYEITCQLPDFAESPHRRVALDMQISLSHVYADIARYVYGPNQGLQKDFVASIKSVLNTLTRLAETLRTAFTLQTNRGMSRAAAHLHLQHLQLVILVIRPILFCCLELLLLDPAEALHLTSLAKVHHLITVCSEAAQNILGILSSLQEQGLLETFLPWDFDALFVSTTVLILIRSIDGTMPASRSDHLDDAFTLFEYMTACGNDVAAHRIHELHALKNMLEGVTPASGLQLNRLEALGSAVPSRQQNVVSQHGPAGATAELGTHNGGTASVDIPTVVSDTGLDVRAEQILAMTDAMDIEETDWMGLLMFDPSCVV